MSSKLPIVKKLLKTQRKIKILKILRIFFLPIKNYLFRSKFGFEILLDFEKDVDSRFYCDDFEKNNLFLFKKFINTGSVILDVGANIGIYSIIAGKKMNGNGKVIAFEPSEWAFERLKNNIAINHLKNIITVKKGISNFIGQVPFYLCEDDAYNSLGSQPMRKTVDTMKISVVTIDKFCTDNNLNKIDIIKVDVEGADYLVLQGAESLLKSEYPPVIFCEYNESIQEGFEYNLKDFERYLENLNYNLYEFNGNKLIKFLSEKSGSYEIICLKDNHFKKYPFLSSLI